MQLFTILVQDGKHAFYLDYIKGNTMRKDRDLSWYLKWTASAFVITAVICRSLLLDPIFDILFSIAGTSGWFIVGWLWRDSAVMVLNGVLSATLAFGILNYFSIV